MKFLIYILFFVFALNFQSFSKYWKEVDNIPAPYNQNYWLDIFVHPNNSNYAWVCGFNGMVIRTTNGGNSWTGSQVPNAYHLEHIHFPSLNVGYTSGPDGIWKSTDAGATWSNITPDAMFPDYWGCYFLDEDNGVLLGGGCITIQSFYKTTDGGQTWTEFNGNEPNSGLTDALLYSNGEGYASSSGIIWQSLDFGSTWNVFSRLGNKVWQEELNKFGNSFLVPYSGYDCQGGGNNGGAKFSVDNGLTWQDKNTGVSMFGSYLLSPLKGWACGDQDNVIYTSDGGLNWEDKDCGLEFGDYDDMWFVNEDEGWIVGAGVYRLAQSTYPISKDTIIINDVCIGERKNDTIWIDNNSFDRSSGRILIPTSSSVYLLNTPTNFMINQCSKYPVIISYLAQADTTIEFKFNILVNEPALDQKNYEITVLLKTMTPTTFPQYSNVVIDSISVGETYLYNLKVFSETNEESLVDYEKLSGSPNISITTKMPIRAFINGNNLEFNFKAIDTGWINASYRLKFDRCNFDTIVNIRAYAYSPIINSIKEFNRTISCTNPIIDTIDIFNNGNDNLIISAYTTRPLNSGVNIIGFLGENLPVIIKPNQSKKIIIESKPTILGEADYELLLINNDATTIRGIKNPHKINLHIDYKKPVIVSEEVIDFGEVCPGKEVSLPLFLHNYGNFDGTSYIENIIADPFSFKFIGNPSSAIIRAEDSIFSYVNFKSNSPGIYEDTLIFRTSPCNDILKVVLRGKVIDSEIEIIPAIVDTMFRAGDTIRVVVRVSAIERDLIIRKIYLDVPDSDWYVKANIILPFFVLKGQAAVFDLEFSTNKTSTLNTKLILENSSLCDTLASLDINLSTFSKFVTAGPSMLDYGNQYCSIKDTLREINISNKGFIDDTISTISIDNNDFEILNKPTLPYVLKIGDNYNLKVKYNPKAEGTSKANIRIETVAPGFQSFDIELIGSYYNSQITVNKTEINFGFVEHCQFDLLDSLIFTSIGLLNDTLDIVDLPTNSFIEINNSQKILPIESGKSTKMFFSLITDNLEPGINELNLKIQSRKCNTIFDVTVKANLISPRLLVNPKPLDFGSLWIGESKSLLLELNNNSNVDIKVTKVEIDSDEFSYNGEQNFVIVANSILTLPINFEAKIEGLKDIPIRFTYKSKCEDSTFGQLLADIPKEEYGIKLRIGHYVSKPDSSLKMALILDGELKYIEPKTININVLFDRKLFFPYKITLPNGFNNSDISFDYSFGNLNLNINGDASKSILKNIGEIIYIEGVVLAAVPDSTELILNEVLIEAEKNIDIELENGSLKVIDFCHETAKFELQFIPTFEAKVKSIIEDSELIYSLKATNQTQIKVRLTSLAGEVFNLGQHYIDTKNSLVKKDISELASGIYFINFQNEYWSKTYKLIIMK